jgi:hypothetical protein
MAIRIATSMAIRIIKTVVRERSRSTMSVEMAPCQQRSQSPGRGPRLSADDPADRVDQAGDRLDRADQQGDQLLCIRGQTSAVLRHWVSLAAFLTGVFPSSAGLPIRHMPGSVTRPGVSAWLRLHRVYR